MNPEPLSRVLEKFLGLPNVSVAVSRQNGDCLFDSFRIALQGRLDLDVQGLRKIVANEVFNERHYESDAAFREYLDLIKGMYEKALVDRNVPDKIYYGYIASAARHLPVSSTMLDYIRELEKALESTVDPARRQLIESDLLALKNACRHTHVDIPRAMSLLAESSMLSNTWGEEIAIHAVLEYLYKNLGRYLVLYTVQGPNASKLTSTQILPRGITADQINASECIFFWYTGGHYRPISSNGRFVFNVRDFPESKP